MIRIKNNYIRRKKTLRLFGFFASLCFFAISFFVIFPSPLHVSAASGVPAIISYQGRLLNASGNLLGGSSGTTYYFKFSIWNVATGGTAGVNRLWPASPASVSATVREGVFNVDIDVSTYNFNTNSAIYLQIEVSDGGSFEPLSPRQQIAAVPFAQIAGAVNGTGQSSMGTTTPIINSVVSIEATSTQSVGLSIRGILSQLANLFQIQNSTGDNLFAVNKSGNLGMGTTTPNTKLNISDINSVPQLRLSQADYGFGEIYADSAGDLRFSSNSGNGGNIRQNNENLWVCRDGGCGMDATPPSDKGNIILENSFIFDNKFKFKQDSASTTMYDAQDNPILQFDNGQ